MSATASAISRVGPRVHSSARQREAEAGVAGHAGRQRDDRERQQPAEDLGIDQKGVADPIEPGEEIAEAEPPAGDRRAGSAAEPAGRRRRRPATPEPGR